MYMIGIYRQDAAHPLIAMHQRQSRHTYEANVHASAEFGVAPSSVCNNQQYLYVHIADSTSSYAKEDITTLGNHTAVLACVGSTPRISSYVV